VASTIIEVGVELGLDFDDATFSGENGGEEAVAGVEAADTNAGGLSPLRGIVASAGMTMAPELVDGPPPFVLGLVWAAVGSSTPFSSGFD
jgi:hypothetical protein